jgi:hypothetical protein
MLYYNKDGSPADYEGYLLHHLSLSLQSYHWIKKTNVIKIWTPEPTAITRQELLTQYLIQKLNLCSNTTFPSANASK